MDPQTRWEIADCSFGAWSGGGVGDAVSFYGERLMKSGAVILLLLIDFIDTHSKIRFWFHLDQ